MTRSLPYIVKFDSFNRNNFSKEYCERITETQTMRIEPEEVHDFEIIIRKTGKMKLITT